MKKPKETDTNLIIRIPVSIKTTLENICAQQDRNVSQIVRDLIRKYISENLQLEFEEIIKPTKGKK